MIIDIAVCFLTSSLAGLGVGGGGLLVVYLTAFRETAQLAAQGINLAVSAALMGAAAIVHMIRRKIKFGMLAAAVIPGIAGAVIGCALAGVIDPDYLRRGFGAFLLICGVASMYSLIKNKRR